MLQSDAVSQSSTAGSSSAGSLSVAAEFAALLPPETSPLLTTRPWAEALTINEPRIASPRAAAHDWHDDIAASLAAGWEAITPGNATARFMHAATADEAVPPAAPADHMREHFCNCAPAFEAALVGRLGYGTSAAMRDALQAWMRAQPAPLRILDLGCGTCLSGPLFRPFAACLAGVDLASRMRDIAAAKGCYDRLEGGVPVAGWLFLPERPHAS